VSTARAGRLPGSCRRAVSTPFIGARKHGLITELQALRVRLANDEASADFGHGKRVTRAAFSPARTGLAVVKSVGVRFADIPIVERTTERSDALSAFAVPPRWNKPGRDLPRSIS